MLFVVTGERTTHSDSSRPPPWSKSHHISREQSSQLLTQQSAGGEEVKGGAYCPIIWGEDLLFQFTEERCAIDENNMNICVEQYKLYHRLYVL